MDIIGIIAEYNPFHNGHIYHIDMIKKMYPDSIIILVVSGYFSQRGEISILTKRQKVEIALEYGIDLVVELPFKFAVQSADSFSAGSIGILNYLGVKRVVFGSESNDVNLLTRLAKTQINNKDFDLLVKKYLDCGYNYPTSLSNSLKELTGYTVSSSNDLLGISYIKEIIKNNYDIEAVAIKRTSNYHYSKDYEEISNDSILGATAIRNKIKEKVDISSFVPDKTLCELGKNKIDYDKYFMFLKYKIITDNQLSQYQTVDEGVHNKLKKEIDTCYDIDEFIERIKTKRYTFNKLNRMFLHILLSFKKEEAISKDISYIRILGFNKVGQKYLNKIKKDVPICLITNITKDNYKLLELEFRASKFYQLLSNRDILEEELEKPVQK